MSVYKAVITTTNNELIHFNRNHDSSNGQFTFGDGDGDGKTNDRSFGKKAFDAYKKVTSNRSMFDYVTQKEADDRKARKHSSEPKPTKAKRVKIKDMNPAELDRYANKEIKRGIAWFATGLGLDMVASVAALSDNEAASAVAFVTGTGLEIAGFVSGVKGVVDKSKARSKDLSARYDN